MWSVMGFALGLSLFFISLRVMSASLVSGVGARLRQGLAKAAGNQYRGFALGALVTAVVQSSSAVNVTAVNLVGTRVIRYEQAIAIMLGANVGTTITAQLAVLPVTEYGWLLVAVGLSLWLSGGRSRLYRSIGGAVTGLGGLFAGLSLMQLAAAPLGHSVVQGLSALGDGSGVWALVAAGAGATAILQSSSVVTGIVVAMVSAGVVDVQTGICLVLGSNIGTVVTSMLASIGMDAWAQRTAITDLLFNALGVLCVLPFIEEFHFVVSTLSRGEASQIANAHTLFNVGASFLALPFVPMVSRLFGARPNRPLA